MAWSDTVGAIASLSIAIPALKDQIYRFRREREIQKAARSPWPGLRSIVAAAWESRRHDYDGFDSFFLGGGGIGLVIAFLLKAFGL
jgi:hypothetical protein